MLRDGATLWDLRLVKVSGDTLVFQGNDSILRFPLMHVDELRLVRKATRSIAPEAGPYGGVLDGGGHEGFPPTPFGPDERPPGPPQNPRAHPPPGQTERDARVSSPAPARFTASS